MQTGYVNTALLLDVYSAYLKFANLFVEESFDYKAIQFHEDYLEYKKIKAKHIVFAEGFGLHLNPFFKHLPLDGTKGEFWL